MTQVSPVTESEMKSFFDRFATSFVSLSEQAGQLVALRQDFDTLNRRVNILVEDNEGLRRQVETLVTERDQARAKAQENWGLAQAEEQAHNDTKRKLQEVQSQYDWKSKDYEALKADRNALQTEKDEQSQRAAKAEQDRDSLKAEVEYVTRQRDNQYQTVRARDDEISRLNAKLAKFKAILEDKLDEAQAEQPKELPTHIASVF